MKFLTPITPRFKKIWGKPIEAKVLRANVDAMGFPIPLPPAQSVPFPGKRKYRWVIFTERQGVLYEGKPSRQAMRHAIDLSVGGRRVYLMEFDRQQAFHSMAFEPYAGDSWTVAHTAGVWNLYHKMDPNVYFQTWRRKARGIPRRKVQAP